MKIFFRFTSMFSERISHRWGNCHALAMQEFFSFPVKCENFKQGPKKSVLPKANI